jgi:lysophospholipase L1-like esterase
MRFIRTRRHLCAHERAQDRELGAAAEESVTWSSWDEYPYRDIHRQVMAAALHAGFETIDLLDAYAQSGRSPIELKGDADHPNAAGHAILARALMEKIVRDHARLFGVDE